MTDGPDWGTPEARPAAEPPHRPRWVAHASATPAPPETVGGFFLVVEQITDDDRWRVKPPPIWAGPDRGVAREAALELARTLAPERPWVPKGRMVLGADPDNLLVIVRGATDAYHFRVTVAQRFY